MYVLIFIFLIRWQCPLLYKLTPPPSSASARTCINNNNYQTTRKIPTIVIITITTTTTGSCTTTASTVGRSDESTERRSSPASILQLLCLRSLVIYLVGRGRTQQGNRPLCIFTKLCSFLAGCLPLSESEGESDDALLWAPHNFLTTLIYHFWFCTPFHFSCFCLRSKPSRRLKVGHRAGRPSSSLERTSLTVFRLLSTVFLLSLSYFIFSGYFWNNPRLEWVDHKSCNPRTNPTETYPW